MTDTNQDKNQDVNIAVIKTDIDYIKKEVGTITSSLAILEKNYVKRSEVDLLLKDADALHKSLATDIKNIELDVVVFKTQVKTWGAAGVLALGLLQFAISVFVK